MPEVADRPQLENNSDRPRSLGVVVKDDKKQREYERALQDWSTGKISYKEMMAKDPSAKKFNVLAFIVDVLLGPK